MIGEENPLNFLLEGKGCNCHVPGWATVTSISPLQVRKDHESAPLDATPETLTAFLKVGDRVLLAEWRGQPVILGKGGG